MGAQAAQDAAGAKVLDAYPCTGLWACLVPGEGWMATSLLQHSSAPGLSFRQLLL